jgi:hypothetical protein
MENQSIQWNPGNTTSHGTDDGWLCYRGGRVSEVENLGVNFPRTAYCKCSIAGCVSEGQLMEIKEETIRDCGNWVVVAGWSHN